jgi:hypothetical protein
MPISAQVWVAVCSRIPKVKPRYTMPKGNNKHLDDSNKGIGCLRRQREAKANDDPAKEEHLGM